jgi:dienelactone hydrolase
MRTAAMKPVWGVLVISAAAFVLSGAAAALGAIKTETVIYQEGQVEAHSVLAYDQSAAGRRPGVLVVPEWWGLNDYAKRRAEMLAKLGYTAMAVDIYGDGKTTVDPKQAGAWSHELRAGDRHELRARIAAALAKLKSEPMVDPTRTAAIGYCFGGTTVLELARSGADVNGVVSFHGGLDTQKPAQPGQIKARILACHGADDPFEPPLQVQAFEDEMRNARADWQLNIYSGAEHSFTNPAADSFHIKGVAYNAEADRRSWRAMRDFFREIFKPRPRSDGAHDKP